MNIILKNGNVSLTYNDSWFFENVGHEFKVGQIIFLNGYPFHIDEIFISQHSIFIIVH